MLELTQGSKLSSITQQSDAGNILESNSPEDAIN